MNSARCDEVRDRLRALHADRLSDLERTRVREHLTGCADCQDVERAEQALSDLLEARLPRPAAPDALRQRLLAMAAEANGQGGAPGASATGKLEPSGQPPRPAAASRPTAGAPGIALVPKSTRTPRVIAGLATFAAAAAALLIVLRPTAPEQSPLLRELVNDHLRVLYAQQPIEIESGGIHQVKPWFEGRVDFAPRVQVDDDPDFPLVGGAVGVVIDRKAATFMFKRRLHVITLFVFRNEGLPWPSGTERMLGNTPAHTSTTRGFNTVMFRKDDLGYALVSDLNMKELSLLGARLAQ